MRAAGLLRDRITIQRATETLDSLGCAVKVWTNQHSRWATVTARAGQETVEGTQIKARYFYTIKLRYLADVKPTDRVLFAGKTLEIVSVNQSPTVEAFTELLCRETA